jgi:hypothetical protein
LEEVEHAAVLLEGAHGFRTGRWLVTLALIASQGFKHGPVCANNHPLVGPYCDDSRLSGDIGKLKP